MYDLAKAIMIDYDRVDGERYVSLSSYAARVTKRSFVDILKADIERALAENAKFGDTVDNIY